MIFLQISFLVVYLILSVRPSCLGVFPFSNLCFLPPNNIQFSTSVFHLRLSVCPSVLLSLSPQFTTLAFFVQNIRPGESVFSPSCPAIFPFTFSTIPIYLESSCPVLFLFSLVTTFSLTLVFIIVAISQNHAMQSKMAAIKNTNFDF